MCGIFGLAVDGTHRVDRRAFCDRIERLFRLSETRGKESCGLAVRRQDELSIYKQAVSATDLLDSKDFDPLMEKVLGGTVQAGGSRIGSPLGFIAHTRLVTNGVQTINENNQPVTACGLTGVHNGIIVNEAQLWRAHGDQQRRTEVDTEILLRLIAKYEAQSGDLRHATARAFGEIRGAASIAVLFDDRTQLLLATNTGSLYIWRGGSQGLLAFASEEFILRKWVEQFEGEEAVAQVRQLAAGEGSLIDLADLQSEVFSLKEMSDNRASTAAVGRTTNSDVHVAVKDYAGSIRESIAALNRCKKCVLPESFPFIKFDDEGVCNYCRNYVPPEVLGREALEDAVKPLRRKDGRPELIVSFSGGRDSSYALHYFREELGMNVLAYTYDWGMVTDLARRNQARMCGQMGVEHILISADINQKRRNVRKNIEAWLRRPDLGMIPLFMAGDKQFFTHANRLSKQTGVNDVVFSTCPYETTHFKTAFCGLNDPKGGMYYAFPMRKIIKLTWYYAMQYLWNPRYLNSSLGDTFSAYFSAFFAEHNYLMFFDYIRWDESVIDRTLRDVYDWEISPDTQTTWRIGDGTAAFYNYIYHTVTGFTENDTFRSNQIRDGVLTREKALAKIEIENQPRWESMQWYARTIGFDFHSALQTIQAMPRLYDMRPLQRIREHAAQAAA